MVSLYPSAPAGALKAINSADPLTKPTTIAGRFAFIRLVASRPSMIGIFNVHYHLFRK
jgi:hypothetical protein